MKRLFLLILSILLLAPSAWGATVYVKPGAANPTTKVQYKSGASGCADATGWTDDSDLEAALTAAGASSTLNICAGTYSGTMIDASDGLDTTATNQTINGIGSVILSGTGISDHVLSVQHGGSTLNSVTVSGSGATYNGIQVAITSGSVIINDVTAEGNGQDGFQSWSNGGTITINRCISRNNGRDGYRFSGSDPSTLAVQLNYSFSYDNGVTGYFVGRGTHIINNTLIYANAQEGASAPAGITPSVTINNSNIFSNNKGGGSGYAITNSSSGTLTVNNSNVLGSGLYPNNIGGGSVTFNNCKNIVSSFKRGRYPAMVILGIDDQMNYMEWLQLADAATSLGLKTVLALQTTGFTSWSVLSSRVANGHEIASHSVTHANLTTLSEPDLSNELINSKAAIEAGIPGYTCKVLVPPNNGTNETVQDAIKAAGYIGARGSGSVYSPLTNVQIYDIYPMKASTAIGTTNIERNISAITEWASSTGQIVFIYDHEFSAYSLGNWTTIMLTLKKSNATVVTLSEACEHINNTRTGFLATGLDADSDGERWTRSLSDSSDFRLLPSSPCINKGTNVGLTTDFLGHSLRGAPDIGAYEYWGTNGGGGFSSMNFNLGW